MSKQAQRRLCVSDVRAEYAKIAAAHARGAENKRRLSLADARKNALRLDWSSLPSAEARVHRHARASTTIRSPS